ncbi:hypothetical protein [Fictibacillus sp. 7GRE50]|nr:hypothetical protein [Fictibacillus sp. 7GRE50]
MKNKKVEKYIIELATAPLINDGKLEEYLSTSTGLTIKVLNLI